MFMFFDFVASAWWIFLLATPTLLAISIYCHYQIEFAKNYNFYGIMAVISAIAMYISSWSLTLSILINLIKYIKEN